MIDIENHMTIPIEFVLDLPSVDAEHPDEPHDGGSLGSVESILDKKLRDVEYYGWDEDFEQKTPIHLFIGDGSKKRYSTGGETDDAYRGKLIMGNGHHRVAHLYAIGRKYVWFTWDDREGISS